MILKNKHLEHVQETYFQHMFITWKIAFRCQAAVVSQVIHGFFPSFSPPWKTDVVSLSEFLSSQGPEKRRVLKD